MHLVKIFYTVTTSSQRFDRPSCKKASIHTVILEKVSPGTEDHTPGQSTTPAIAASWHVPSAISDSTYCAQPSAIGGGGDKKKMYKTMANSDPDVYSDVMGGVK